jgi:hypothetical protein
VQAVAAEATDQDWADLEDALARNCPNKCKEGMSNQSTCPVHGVSRKTIALMLSVRHDRERLKHGEFDE